MIPISEEKRREILVRLDAIGANDYERSTAMLLLRMVGPARAIRFLEAIRSHVVCCAGVKIPRPGKCSMCGEVWD